MDFVNIAGSISGGAISSGGLSTALVTLSQPKGVWESILNSFKGGLGTYILAVILIAVLVRLLFSVVDIINKKVSAKNTQVNAKMKPELDAIKAKYGNDPAMMQQKTNEIYKKYQFSMMSSCLPMLISLVLQFTVFLTLWNSLQAVSNYNIANQYQNMKNVYENVILLNEKFADADNTQVLAFKQTLDGLKTSGAEISLNVDVNFDTNQMKITIFNETDQTEVDGGLEVEFVDGILPDGTADETWTNTKFYETMLKYVPEFKTTEAAKLAEIRQKEQEEQEKQQAQQEQQSQPEEEQEGQDGQEDQGTEETVPTIWQAMVDSATTDYVNTGYNQLLLDAAEKAVEKYYFSSRESFMWIKNIYKAESPTTNPMFTESEIKNYLAKFYTADERAAEVNSDFEGKIFPSVVAGIDTSALGVNGYYILTIVAVLTSVLSMWLSTVLMRDKNQPKQKQNILMYFVMPIIIGIFTLMYTSLFAIYVIVGQLIMMLLTPLTTWIVKKWNKHDEDKKNEKDIIEVDYRRKGI